MNYDYICLVAVRTFRSGGNILIYQCKKPRFFYRGDAVLGCPNETNGRSRGMIKTLDVFFSSVLHMMHIHTCTRAHAYTEHFLAQIPVRYESTHHIPI